MTPTDPTWPSIWYYDSTYATGSTASGCWYQNPSCATTTSTTANENATYSNVINWTTYYRPRSYIVTAPDHWTREDAEALSDLVNHRTKTTGFKVTLIIRGEIEITDPTMERRTMRDFVPLLKAAASAEDRKTIDAFFKDHKLTAGDGNESQDRDT